MKLQFSTLLLSAALLVCCGNKNDSAQNEAAKNAPSVDDAAMSASAVVNGNKVHKSAEHALSTDVLAGFLPSVSGYTPGEPEKVSMNMQGTEYSTAGREYKNGEKSIKVTLMDYNYISGLSAAYSMFLNNFSMENETEVQKSEKFGSYPGWVNWKKKGSMESQIGIVVNDRIFVILEGQNGATIDDLRAIVKQMNLDGVAKAAA